MDDRDDPSGELSTDGISKATSLADELYRRDVERKSVVAAAEEIGIPAEYLARAAVRIQAEKALRAETLAKRRKVAAIAACVVVIAVAVNVTFRRSLSAEEAAANLPQTGIAAPAGKKSSSSPPVLSSPDPDAVSVSVLPFEPTAPVAVSSHEVGSYPAHLTFANQYEKTVDVHEMSAEGVPDFRFTLAPGKMRNQPTAFGHPWLITDEKGKNLGVVFPQGGNGICAIPSAVVLHSLVFVSKTDRRFDFPGYLQPVADEESRTKGGPAAAAHRLQTAIEFVNFTGLPADLYRAETGAARTKVTTIAPGANFVATSYTADRWIAVDAQHDVIGTFKPDPIPRTAILWAK